MLIVQYVNFILNMIKQSLPKIISCFAVCGIDPQIIPLKSQIQQKYITGLEFVKQKSISHERQKEIEITNNLFLKIIYSQTNKPPIIQIEFFYLEIHESSVKMVSNQWLPVIIRGNEKFNKEAHFYRQKQINIGQFLNDKKKIEKALVLCYRTGLKEKTMDAITDIEILQSQRKQVSRKSIQQKQIFSLPSGFNIINNSLTFKTKSKYLIFKRMKGKLEVMYKAKLLEAIPQNSSNSKISLNPLPFFCFPDGVAFSEDQKGFYTFSFMLTLQTTQRIYASCLVFKQQADQIIAKQLGSNKKIYCEKAICILSQYSYPQEFTKLLFQIYRISVSPNDIPFYKVIQNLNDITLVDKQNWGKITVDYCYGGCKIIFRTNTLYPTVSEKSIFCLFKFLQISKIICLFEAMLLEKRIFLISRNKSVLGLVIEALLSFLFPFQWEQVLIPILPSNLRQYIQAPVPFIIGLTQVYSQIQYEKQVIIVNFDRNQISNQEGLPPLPSKIQKQLEKRLTAYKQLYNSHEVKQYLQSSQNPFLFRMETQMYQSSCFDAYDIRDAFYQFHLTLMKNYTKYWIKNLEMSHNKMYSVLETTAQQNNYTFNTSSFLDDLGMSKVGSFGFKFTETSMFIAFIQNRTIQLQMKKQTYFEKCIEKKKNKKNTKFIIQNNQKLHKKVAPPKWQINNSITYIYKTFPSILCDHQKIQSNRSQVKSTAIAQYNQQVQKQKNNKLIQELYEKADIYKDFINQGTYLNVYPKQLDQIQISQQLKRLVCTFISKEQMSEAIYKIKTKIKQNSRQYDKFKEIKNENIVLNWLNEAVRQFQKLITRVLQDLKTQSKFKNIKKQFIIDTFGVRYKHEYEESNIIGYHTFNEFHTIKYENKLILFYENNLDYNQFKKIQIKIQNKLLKHIINTILFKHLEALTVFFIEKVQKQNSKIHLNFKHILQFKNWLYSSQINH